MMKEDDLLKFADFMDTLAEMNPDYGTDLFFKFKEDKKLECLKIINRIEEIDSEIPTVDRSKKGKLSYEKGILLEQLAKKILSCRNIFSVSERVICDSNEIDLLLKPTDSNALYKSLLPDYLKIDCLVECKNHKNPIDVTLLGKFYSLMRYKKANVGFMISNKELTGQTHWEDAVGLTKKFYLRDDTLIINITIKMIKDLLNSDGNIITLIKSKVDEIIYHTQFDYLVVEHPAEKLMDELNNINTDSTGKDLVN